MLSAQTKDEVTAKAMSELQKMPLTIENFLNADDEVLEKNIYPVSRKGKHDIGRFTGESMHIELTSKIPVFRPIYRRSKSE